MVQCLQGGKKKKKSQTETRFGTKQDPTSPPNNNYLEEQVTNYTCNFVICKYIKNGQDNFRDSFVYFY